MPKKRLDKNSVTRKVEGFQGAIDEIPIPEGVELRSEEEQVIWRQFTRARASEDWRDMDLLLLAKVVRYEADIRQHQRTLDRSGVLLQNKRGTMVPNPLISVIDTLQRTQLSVIRSMSLNQTPNDARTIAGTARTEAEARGAMKSGNVVGLLAGSFTNG